MQRVFFSALLFFGVFTGTAHATGEIYCRGGEEVTIDLNVGRLEVLNVLSANIALPGENWTTFSDREQHRQILIGQAFGDLETTFVDFMDINAEAIIAKLRLFNLSENDDYKTGGLFSVKDKGVWVVECETG